MFNKIINAIYSLVTSTKANREDTTDEQDENIGELFIYYIDGATYRYLMTANTLPVYKSNTFVILKNIETLRTHALPWNEFFGSTGSDSARIPNFKKIEAGTCNSDC